MKRTARRFELSAAQSGRRRPGGSERDMLTVAALCMRRRRFIMKSPLRPPVSRRGFLSAAAAPALCRAAVSEKPAILGGTPVRATRFPGWPVHDEAEDSAMLEVVRSGRWGRLNGSAVSRFESMYASLMGAGHCLATSSGTTALFTALSALGVGPGDEVVLPAYTFVACANVILQHYALPVFADTDPETFQIDPASLESAITDRTAALMPVHLGGATFEVERVQAIANKRGLPIVEDSCQSHLAEWRGKRTGSFGKAGCFSFQASKNLNSGEGGAVLTNDAEMAERCYAFHNNSRGRRQAGADFSYQQSGFNARMTEFQAAILLSQMKRLEQQYETREKNAAYLSSMLRELGGLTPARTYAGCTRNAYHLYMMRYDAEQFAGLPRARFLKALAAEGVPASGGYSPLNKEPFLRNTFATRGYQMIYGKKRLADWFERNQLPANDRLCSEAVWLTQNQLLGSRRDMEQIVEAVRKIKQHASELARA
ncbi:MAG TPA: DegT/DnrJ/EryC1/StrS family aminotransferase [Bryobacteraceae bacterium]|nr:DegT/DnrJ/EryC1/StrS family aminotransferase [Bryobacteraceae bacterium]